MRTNCDIWFIGHRGYSMRTGNPFLDFTAAGECLFGQVVLLEQALVVAIALIDERIVDVRQ